MEYKFSLDSKEVLAKKGDYSFRIGIKEGVDPNKVRTLMDKISPNIGYSNYLPHLNYLICVTDDQTWKEKFDGNIPEGLEKLVNGIYLNGKVSW